MGTEEFINIFINENKGSSIVFDRDDVKEMLEDYKDLHLKITEEKFETDYKRIKQDYKAQIDLDALCCAVADAEQEYHDKYVKPLIEALTSIALGHSLDAEFTAVEALKDFKP